MSSSKLSLFLVSNYRMDKNLARNSPNFPDCPLRSHLGALGKGIINCSWINQLLQILIKGQIIYTNVADWKYKIIPIFIQIMVFRWGMDVKMEGIWTIWASPLHLWDSVFLNCCYCESAHNFSALEVGVQKKYLRSITFLMVPS